MLKIKAKYWKCFTSTNDLIALKRNTLCNDYYRKYNKHYQDVINMQIKYIMKLSKNYEIKKFPSHVTVELLQSLIFCFCSIQFYGL